MINNNLKNNKKLKYSYLKVFRILNDIGMSKYIELFQNEEIDYMVFKMLTNEDLITIGIDNQNDREIVMNAINYHHKFC